ncbi:MAG: MarC family protein [Candidatus Aenigmatarchaeota archaeon]
MLTGFLQAFIILFMIMDPFSSYIVFADITKKFSKKEKIKSVNKAVTVAGILAFIFIIGGNSILDVFSISLRSFTIVGGIVLFLLGLEMILNFKISKEKARNYSVAAVIIATPITTGPGVITSVIFFTNSIGAVLTSLALLLSLSLIWVFLRAYGFINKFLGKGTVDIISKVMGIFIAARGIDLILSFF